MKTLLWLDDKRNPFIDEDGKVPEGDWDIIWVLNFEQLVDWIDLYGLPDAISFDHDLAPEHYTPEFFWSDYKLSKAYQEYMYPTYMEYTGRDCARWVYNYARSKNKPLPEIFIHTDNPVGADWIKEVFSPVGELS